jgi:REP element-mobilizing transposase RayT
VKSINGTSNHVHILLLLNPLYSISDIIKNIKGESSHWVNQNNFLNLKFSWQIGYGAFSVSESDIDKVSKYIENQHKHHKKMTFMEEYELFMKKYGIKFANR